MAANEAELRALMKASLAGDAHAHRTLLNQLSANLRAYYKTRLARIGRSATEAEDLTQEALMAIHTRRHTYDPAEALTPWVYAIARYKLIDHLRHTRASMTDLPIEDAEELLAPLLTAPAMAQDTLRIDQHVYQGGPKSGVPHAARQTTNASEAFAMVPKATMSHRYSGGPQTVVPHSN
jgi:RNA polymerase sigma factor (sigma-70 family)